MYNLQAATQLGAAQLVHSSYAEDVPITRLITFYGAVVTILETVPDFHSLPGSVRFGLETSLVALYIINTLEIRIIVR